MAAEPAAAEDPTPKERATWLGDQPEGFQARVLQTRLVQEVGDERVYTLVRRAWRRPVREGALLFFSLAVFIPFVGVTEMLLALPVGAVVGLLWYWLKAGQMTSMLIAMPFGLFFFGSCAGGLGAVLGTMLVAAFSSYLGIQREMP